MAEALVKKYCATDYPTCRTCTNKTEFRTFRSGFRAYCSFKCSVADLQNRNAAWCKTQGVVNPSQLDRVKAKKKETSNRHYGTDNPMQSEEGRRKYTEGLQAIYGEGVINPSHVPGAMEKKVKTWMRKYGCDNPSKSPVVLQRIRDKLTSTVGYPSAFMSPEVRAKYRKAFKEKHGVENPMHVPSIFEHNQKQRKCLKYITLKGRTYMYQGYEGYVIENLVKRGFTMAHILGSAWYKYQRRDHRYYPDLAVRKDGNIYVVEVKSTFTLGVKDYRRYWRNRAKFKAAHKQCEALGMTFWLVVWHKGNFFCRENPGAYSLKDVRARMKKSDLYQKNVTGY